MTDGITDKNKKHTKELLSGQKLLLGKGVRVLLREPPTSSLLNISWMALFIEMTIFDQPHLFAHGLQFYIHKLCFFESSPWIEQKERTLVYISSYCIPISTF